MKGGSIDKSATKMSEYDFSKSPFLFISSYIIRDKVNLSAGAPYCRDCPNKAYEITSSGTKEIVSVDSKDIAILNNVGSTQEYRDIISKYNSLDRIV